METMVQTGFVLIGLLFVIAFVYMVVLLSVKLLGIIITLGGLWMLLYLPGQTDYQKASFTETGRGIGLIMLIIGILMLTFG